MSNASDKLVLQDEDCDFLAKMSKLINCMGIQLMSAYQK